MRDHAPPAAPSTHAARPLTWREGMREWYVPEFDAVAAGWKKGLAPFGQLDGKLEPLSTSCTAPFCGCGEAPKTLWKREVLMLRKTVDLPLFWGPGANSQVFSIVSLTWTSCRCTCQSSNLSGLAILTLTTRFAIVAAPPWGLSTCTWLAARVLILLQMQEKV